MILNPADHSGIGENAASISAFIDPSSNKHDEVSLLDITSLTLAPSKSHTFSISRLETYYSFRHFSTNQSIIFHDQYYFLGYIHTINLRSAGFLNVAINKEFDFNLFRKKNTNGELQSFQKSFRGGLSFGSKYHYNNFSIGVSYLNSVEYHININTTDNHVIAASTDYIMQWGELLLKPQINLGWIEFDSILPIFLFPSLSCQYKGFTFKSQYTFEYETLTTTYSLKLSPKWELSYLSIWESYDWSILSDDFFHGIEIHYTLKK